MARRRAASAVVPLTSRLLDLQSVGGATLQGLSPFPQGYFSRVVNGLEASCINRASPGSASHQQCREELSFQEPWYPGGVASLTSRKEASHAPLQRPPRARVLPYNSSWQGTTSSACLAEANPLASFSVPCFSSPLHQRHSLHTVSFADSRRISQKLVASISRQAELNPTNGAILAWVGAQASTWRCLSTAGGPLLSLNDLRPARGSTYKSKRLGRGIGSGKGKTAGRGHKGQKARSRNPRIGFEGGQTPLRLRLPKRGFHNPFKMDFQVVNLEDVLFKIQKGAIDPSALITMKTLKDAGLGGKAMLDGVKLLARGAKKVDIPLHFEVSRVSASAKRAVEAAGGTVIRVHYNTLGLRALLKPEWFAKKGRLLPRPARPPPRIIELGLVDATGRLPAPTQRAEL